MAGGTWFHNRYPGARCDIESMDYSYSFDDDLQQGWSWSERYASRPELLRYLEHVADRYDLRPSIQLNTWVVSAHFDDSAFAWTLTTDAGEAVTARWCLMATGFLSIAAAPTGRGSTRSVASGSTPVTSRVRASTFEIGESVSLGPDRKAPSSSRSSPSRPRAYRCSSGPRTSACRPRTGRCPLRRRRAGSRSTRAPSAGAHVRVRSQPAAERQPLSRPHRRAEARRTGGPVGHRRAVHDAGLQGRVARPEGQRGHRGVRPGQNPRGCARPAHR
jgi:hypothetical protein